MGTDRLDSDFVSIATPNLRQPRPSTDRKSTNEQQISTLSPKDRQNDTFRQNLGLSVESAHADRSQAALPARFTKLARSLHEALVKLS